MPLLPFSNKPPAGGANTALSNLASVAINTSLISDTDVTDDLGSLTLAWRKLYIGGANTTSDSGIQFGNSGTAANNAYIYRSGTAAVTFLGDNGFKIREATTITSALTLQAQSGTIPFYIEGPANSSYKIELYGHWFPKNDSSFNLGSSSKYWANTYTDKLFLNATATLDGATAGHIKFVGDLVPATDDTEWVGEIGTPFKAIKGFVIKDTTNGKHYSVTVVSGVLTATALD